VPAVEKIGCHLNTLSVFCHGAFQIADSEVATRVIKNFINRMLCHIERSEISLAIPAAVGLRNKN
jgi:hypothetical protein